MTKKVTQGQRLEVIRGEMGMGQSEFCAQIGVSRQWYSGQLKKKMDVLGLKSLSEMALDQAGTWMGALAVQLLIEGGNERFIPCVCQTEIGDCGPCPKHTPQTPLSASQTSPQIPLRGYLEGKEIAEVAA